MGMVKELKAKVATKAESGIFEEVSGLYQLLYYLVHERDDLDTKWRC